MTGIIIGDITTRIINYDLNSEEMRSIKQRLDMTIKMEAYLLNRLPTRRDIVNAYGSDKELVRQMEGSVLCSQNYRVGF